MNDQKLKMLFAVTVILFVVVLTALLVEPKYEHGQLQRSEYDIASYRGEYAQLFLNDPEIIAKAYDAKKYALEAEKFKDENPEKFDFSYRYLTIGDSLLIHREVAVAAALLMTWFLGVAFLAYRRSLIFEDHISLQENTSRLILNNDSVLFSNLVVIPVIFYTTFLIDSKIIGVDMIPAYTFFVAPIVSLIYFIFSAIKYDRLVYRYVGHGAAIFHIVKFLSIYSLIIIGVSIFLDGSVW